MKERINISSDVSMPASAVTQTFACIGRKGAGKTYLATKLAEEMLDLHAQIIVIDPVGNWFGLRIAEDGKGKGKDIFIAGGEHGDIPLTVESGSRIARLVVEKNVSIILDVSNFRQGERKRFATDFAEEFFHLKKRQKSAVHLFVEEAQLFAPQRVMTEEARMLGAFENIIRLGRNYGIGATLITQRPQSVNKEVLSQTECLCVLQVNGTQERKALEEWVQEAGADRKLVGELPGLARGEGFIWSPAWLRIFQKVKFSKKTTFDASATPEVGIVTKKAMLTAVDVEALKKELQTVIEAAEKDDPKVLRAEIAELRKQLKAKVPDAEPWEIKLWKDQSTNLQKVIDQQKDTMDRVNTFAQGVIETAESIQVAIGSMKVIIGKQPVPVMPKLKPENEWPKPVPAKRNHSVDDGLNGPERRILDAMNRLRSARVYPCPRVQVAILSDYSNQSSTGFAKGVSSLSSKGLIRYPSPGYMELTPDGEEVAGPVDPLRSNEELHEKLFQMMPGPETRVLRPLIDWYPKPVSRESLAEMSGYGNISSTGFAKAVSRLSSLGLIEYPERGSVRASNTIFPM
jgi:hypothetical protein